MSTCEELYADILVMNAAIIVDNANLIVDNASLTAHQMQKWYDQLNYSYQGCGTPPMARENEAAIRSVRDELWGQLSECMQKQIDEAKSLHQKAVDAANAALSDYNAAVAARAAIKPTVIEDVTE